ncbi:ArsR/SmtB family transcription factor [Rufibacter ruber]|uniref:ArsR/SmtB family transcription factor n=1 Tax=Rufibacter ruber TaxID=1783499 RepID=UPI00083698CD|nr:metalloregulator ArsR/SmtB family transcription factor [Rufibacter ruber]
MKDGTNSCIRVFADADHINTCKKRMENVNETIQVLANALSLAGNEVRLKILFLLYEEQNLCVCDLSDVLNMNVSAISQHLRKLKDGNIIKSKKTGQTIFYALNPEFGKLFQPYFSLIEKNQIDNLVS